MLLAARSVGLAGKLWIIVGAGAVGSALGLALTRAGQHVAFMPRKGAKPSTEATFRQVEARGGRREQFALEWLTELPPARELAALCLCTRADQLDQVLSDLAAQIGARPGVPVVFFQPAFHDREKVQRACPGSPLVQGNPGFLAYFEGDVLHYWVPPLVKTDLEVVTPTAADTAEHPTAADTAQHPTAADTAQQLATLMARGGFGARVVDDVRAAIQILFAYAMPLLLAFEQVGFSWERLGTSGALLREAAQAGREAARVARVMLPRAAVWTAVLPGLPARLVSLVLRLALRVVDDFVKTMWRVHASKIQYQTHAMVDELLDEARSRSLPVSTLRTLRERIGHEHTAHPA